MIGSRKRFTRLSSKKRSRYFELHAHGVVVYSEAGIKAHGKSFVCPENIRILMKQGHCTSCPLMNRKAFQDWISSEPDDPDLYHFQRFVSQFGNIDEWHSFEQDDVVHNIVFSSDDSDLFFGLWEKPFHMHLSNVDALEKPTIDVQDAQEKHTTGVQDTKEKHTTWVQDTKEKQTTGVQDTKEKQTTGVQDTNETKTTGVHDTQEKKTTGVHDTKETKTSDVHSSLERKTSDVHTAMFLNRFRRYEKCYEDQTLTLEDIHRGEIYSHADSSMQRYRITGKGNFRPFEVSGRNVIRIGKHEVKTLKALVAALVNLHPDEKITLCMMTCTSETFEYNGRSLLNPTQYKTQRH